MGRTHNALSSSALWRNPSFRASKVMGFGKTRKKERVLPLPILLLSEIRQVRRRLVLAGRHQLAVGADVIILFADANMRIIFRACFRVPGGLRVWIAVDLLFLDVGPGERIVDDGHFNP